MAVSYKIINTPVGKLTLVADEENLCGVFFGEKAQGVNHPMHPILKQTQTQLDEYFRGQRKVFDLPLKMKGTDFQRKVWKSLRTIPYGETQSYLQLARKTGSPRAYRAVGSANGKNPISIIVPCHRVIASDGKLGGFGGGLQAKAFLLGHEKALLGLGYSGQPQIFATIRARLCYKEFRK
jgi:methylated-DNA-[protein]-cysteine S-methyltransferase